MKKFEEKKKTSSEIGKNNNKDVGVKIMKVLDPNWNIEKKRENMERDEIDHKDQKILKKGYLKRGGYAELNIKKQNLDDIKYF